MPWSPSARRNMAPVMACRGVETRLNDHMGGEDQQADSRQGDQGHDDHGDLEDSGGFHAIFAGHANLKIDKLGHVGADRIDRGIKVGSNEPVQPRRVARAKQTLQLVHRRVGGGQGRRRALDQSMLVGRHARDAIGVPVAGDGQLGGRDGLYGLVGRHRAVARLVCGIDDVDGVHVDGRLQLLHRDHAIGEKPTACAGS